MTTSQLICLNKLSTWKHSYLSVAIDGYYYPAHQTCGTYISLAHTSLQYIKFSSKTKDETLRSHINNVHHTYIYILKNRGSILFSKKSRFELPPCINIILILSCRHNRVGRGNAPGTGANYAAGALVLLQPHVALLSPTCAPRVLDQPVVAIVHAVPHHRDFVRRRSGRP